MKTTISFFCIAFFSLLTGCQHYSLCCLHHDVALSEIDKELLTYFASARFNYIQIDSKNIIDAMDNVNQLLCNQYGVTGRLSYIILINNPPSSFPEEISPFSEAPLPDLENPVKFSLNNVSLGQVLNEIARQSGYHIEINNGIRFTTLDKIRQGYGQGDIEGTHSRGIGGIEVTHPRAGVNSKVCSRPTP